MLGVLRMHRDAAATHRRGAVSRRAGRPPASSWDEACETARSSACATAQASVLAPTGTIGLMMDCDTTGIEPDLGLVKMKKLVGGGTMTIVNQTIPRALRRLGYTEQQVDDIVAYIDREEHPRCPAPRRRARLGVRLLHGRQHHPLRWVTCG
jgi:ribonucleoside-diphosphate reductase alpha chain